MVVAECLKQAQEGAKSTILGVISIQPLPRSALDEAVRWCCKNNCLNSTIDSVELPESASSTSLIFCDVLIIVQVAP